MADQAFQDFYPDDVSRCYGCGKLNKHGHQIKSRWDGEESVAFFTPRTYHTAIPGYVYGGLLASLIDCHGTGTAAATGYRVEGRGMDTEPRLRYVTAHLRVDYLKPTPIGGTLEIRGRVKEIKGRKVVVEAWIKAGQTVCVRGEVVAVQMPESMLSSRKGNRRAASHVGANDHSPAPAFRRARRTRGGPGSPSPAH